MIFEIAILICTLFFIFVWFYKQRRSEIELLQVEFAQAATSLRELSQEMQPIIIRGVPLPPNLNSERLGQIPRLETYPLQANEPTATLGAYLKGPKAVLPDWQAAGRPIIAYEAGAILATDLTLPLWVSKVLQDALLDLGAITFLTKIDTRVVLGGCGLTRSIPSVLCILPTEGIYTVSLVSQSSEAFLPVHWENRYPQSFTINDSSMVSEIKYIDVIVRPGTMICNPAQMLVSMQPKDVGTFNAALILEVHSPISRLAKFLAQV